jgi:hypothetical protein
VLVPWRSRRHHDLDAFASRRNTGDMRHLWQTLRVKRLFHREPGDKELSRVIVWWELRRLAFNLMVGAAGLLTCAAAVGTALFSERRYGVPVGLPDPPGIALLAIFAYGIGANLCYTGGWLTECRMRAERGREKADAFAEIAFAAGLAFSILLTLLPIAFFAAAVLCQEIARPKN